MVTVQWGKGNITNLSGTTELTLISRNPKHHWGLPVRVGAYGGHVINEILAQVYLTVEPVGSLTHTVVISSVLECIIVIDLATGKIPTLFPCPMDGGLL